jgi:hypothetical protein
MALKYKTELRNAKLDAIETYIGTSAALRIYSGTAPSAVTDANSGTLLADFTLPSDWLAAAANGSKAINNGPWNDTSADGTATAGHFRIYNNQTTKDGTTCVIQGSVGQGTGDLQLDNTSITTGQTVSITAFTITDGNG